uniref:p2 n=1 Tax=Blackberry virus F TaxID=2560349 RepID=A0A1D7T0T9_9VIRU|nr:P2 [Blackberry virus F]
MSDWRVTQGSSVYKEATQALEGLDSPSVGFARGSDLVGATNSSLQVIIKQQNLQIQLLVKLTEKVEDLQQEIKTLKAAKAKAAAETSSEELESQISDLSKKLDKVSLGTGIVPKKRTPYYVKEDPLKIFEREFAKTKK